MPVAKVQLPDGRIGRFEVPEGTTPEQVMEFARQNMGQFDAPEPSFLQKAGRAADDVVRSIASGATFGFADELAALAGSATGIGGKKADYAGNVVAERARDKEISPYVSIPGEIAGGLMTGTGLARSGLTLMGAANPSLTGMMLRGAGEGAGYGALYGAGSAEGGLANRLRGAAAGAAIGGAAGGVLAPAVDLAAKGATAVANQTINRLPFRQEQAAARKVAEALVRDGLTPDQALARIQQLGPEAALLDVGPNAQALARSAYTVPGGGKAPIKNFLTARQEGTRAPDKTLQGGQINRITKGINEMVPDDFFATREGLAGRNLAADLYDEAYKANLSVESSEIDKILNTPAGRAALKKAANMMQNDRTLVSRVDPELTAALREAADLGQQDYIPGGVGRGLKLRTLDYVKRALGDIEQSAAQGGGRDEARIIGDLRRALTSELDAADVTARAGPNSMKAEGGAYANARRLSADKFRNQEALESGVNFMSRGEYLNPQELAQSLAKMGPQEIHNFRVGAAQAIKQKIGDLNVRSDATKRIMDIPALEQKISQAFGDGETFRRYIGMLENERAMFDSYGKILGGSRTGEVLAEQADRAVDPSRIAQGLREIFMPHSIVDPVRGAVNVAGGIKDRALMPEPMARNLAQILTGRDMTALNKAFQTTQMSEAGRRSLARMLVTGGGLGAGNAAP